MRLLCFILTLVTLTSCNWAKDKAKGAVHKSGEIVAKAGSEFADGVSDGVERSFENKVTVSEELQQQGLEVGRMTEGTTDTPSRKIITAYLVYNQDLSRPITVRLLDEVGKEYGRATTAVTGKKGEAQYIDFAFDKRTSISSRGTASFQ